MENEELLEQIMHDNYPNHSQNPQHSDKQPSPVNVIDVCANCCSLFHPSTSRANQVEANSRDYSSFSENVLVNEAENSCRVDGLCSPNVNKMLTIIYNLDFIPRLKKKYSSSTSTGNKVIEIEELDFPLCCPCTNLLKGLFSLYSQFNQIRKIGSLLTQQINSLNSLIDFSQCQDQESIPKNKTSRDSIRKTNSDNNSSSKFEFPSYDRGPWVKVGPRLEDLTIEEIGYAPPSFRRLYQEAQENDLIIGDVFSVQSPLFSPHDNTDDDDDNDNDNDMDYAPSPLSDNLCYEDVKPFAIEPASRKMSTRSKKKSSTRTRSKPTTTKKRKKPERGNAEKRSVKVSKSKRKKKSVTVKQDEEMESSETDDNEFSSRVKKEIPGARKIGEEEEEEEEETEDHDQIEDLNVNDFLIQLPLTDAEPPALTYDQVTKKEEIFTDRSARRRYRRRQEKVPCPCIYCKMDFDNPEDRAAHVRKKHMKGRNYLCETCGATFKGQYTFDFHQNLAIRKCSAYVIKLGSGTTKTAAEPGFPCTVYINEEGQMCPFRGKSELILKRHMLNVHADEKDKVKCSVCDKVFKTAVRFKEHFDRIHTEKGRATYERHQEKKYKKRKEQRKEVNDRGFICPHCGLDCIYKQKYTVHLRTVHDDYGVEKVAVCEFCGKKFEKNENLLKHRRIVHTEERLFICEECGSNYKSQLALNAHRRRCHTEEGRKKFNAYTRKNYQRKKMIKLQTKNRNEGVVGADMGLIDFGGVQVPGANFIPGSFSSANAFL